MRLIWTALLVAGFAAAGTGPAQPPPGQPPAAPAPAVFPPPDVPLDTIPESVAASMEVRNRFLASLARGQGLAPDAVVEDAVRWAPGGTVTVAFLGGSPALHRDIAEATRQITDSCNLKLDFGPNPATGQYRAWSTGDAAYKADIRVSFDQAGYYSLVGRDSVDPTIGNPVGPDGGRPNQRSLNLGGFHVSRPAGWRRTTRHEFLHALAFHHEHQHPSAVCGNEFRWQDDPEYIPTTDGRGMYVTDANGRRPGIYTYMAGYPNYWGSDRVDRNLRPLPPAGLTPSAGIDQRSIMLYRFPALFYRTSDSPCAPAATGDDLSDGDRAGLARLYPADPTAARAAAARQDRLFDTVLKQPRLPQPLKESYESKRKSIR